MTPRSRRMVGTALLVAGAALMGWALFSVTSLWSLAEWAGNVEGLVALSVFMAAIATALMVGGSRLRKSGQELE